MALGRIPDSGTLLITGCSGFVGRALVDAACRAGMQVTGLSRQIADDLIETYGIDYISADITDADGLAAAIDNREFDYVINCAGDVSHALYKVSGINQFEHHYLGVLNLIDAVMHDDLKSFIQIGSSDEYGDAPSPQEESMREKPISPYSCAKASSSHAIEMLNRTEGFPGIVARLFLVYGPGQSSARFIPQIIEGCLSGGDFPVSLGKQLRDFCYIDDAVDALLRMLGCAELHGEIVNVASGCGITIRQVVEMIHTRINSGVPRFGEVPYRVGESMTLFADIGKITAKLGWRPTTSLEDGLDKTIEWFKSQNQ